MHHGPLVKWLRQRPLTPLTSVRIRYGSPDFSRAKVLDKGSEIQYNTVCSPARPDDIELVLIRARVHPFPFRTRQLSSFLLTILGWRRPGKIGSANTERPHRLMWPFSSHGRHRFAISSSGQRKISTAAQPFIAHVETEDGLQICHVKNTGRCRGAAGAGSSGLSGKGRKFCEKDSV